MKIITKFSIIFLFFAVLLTMFTSCERKQIKNEIEVLNSELTSLQKQVEQKEKELKLIHQETKISVEKRNSHQKEVEQLEKTLKNMRILTSGRNPQYILKIELKQSRISLDISKHIKDKMNKIEFEIPVDKEFYESISVGTKITKQFRIGSFILNGTWSDWQMTVKEKTIR